MSHTYRPMLPRATTRTRAPGLLFTCGATSRQDRDQLSLAEAMATGSRPSGSGTSMASAYGTRTRSEKRPPQLPPMGAPYMAMCGTAVQCAVSPALQGSHVPQLMDHGTTTRSPGTTAVTASPVSTTRATHSWPRAKGGPTLYLMCGCRRVACPARIAESTSQEVAATGVTIASRSDWILASGASRHSTECRAT